MSKQYQFVKRSKIHFREEDCIRSPVHDEDRERRLHELLQDGWDPALGIVHVYREKPDDPESDFVALSCFRRGFATESMPDLDVPIDVLDHVPPTQEDRLALLFNYCEQYTEPKTLESGDYRSKIDIAIRAWEYGMRDRRTFRLLFSSYKTIDRLMALAYLDMRFPELELPEACKRDRKIWRQMTTTVLLNYVANINKTRSEILRILLSEDS